MCREEEDVLKHLSEMFPKGSDLDLPDIHAVDEHLAASGTHSSGRSVRGSSSPEPVEPTKATRLLRIYMEGNAFEHPLAGHIAEPDVFELDLAPDLGELHRIPPRR